MSTTQAVLLGVMIACSPSLVLLAWFLRLGLNLANSQPGEQFNVAEQHLIVDALVPSKMLEPTELMELRSPPIVPVHVGVNGMASNPEPRYPGPAQ